MFSRKPVVSVLHYPERPDGTFACEGLARAGPGDLTRVITFGSDPENPRRAWWGVIRRVQKLDQRLIGRYHFAVVLERPLLADTVRPQAPRAWDLGWTLALEFRSHLEDVDLPSTTTNDELDALALPVATDAADGQLLAGSLTQELERNVFLVSFAVMTGHILSNAVASRGIAELRNGTA